MPTWRQRVALVGFGVALAFVVLELSLRLAGVLWLAAREHREAADPSPVEAVRVLCIGESTTALGGETAYPRPLEEILERDGGGSCFPGDQRGRSGHYD